ncbi:hypothetical protein CHUAL_006537 [Chamberlinius hualienensis]
MNSENHNTNYKLLMHSGSDSETEIPEFTLPKRKVKIKKKHRPNGPGRSNALLQRKNCCSVIFILKVLAVLMVAVSIGVTIWLAVNLHLKVDDLRLKYSLVEESEKSTPSEFHSIHSQLNELQKNHLALKEEVDQLNKTLESISKEITSLKKTTTDIQKSIADAPQLETLPKDFKSLSQSLASMGSKITDLETTLELLKGQLASGSKDKLPSQEMLADLQKKVDALSSIQDKGADNSNLFSYVDNEVKRLEDSLFETNNSIWEQLNWAKTDLHEHHKMIEANRNSSLNLTARLTVMESTALGSTSLPAEINEQFLLKINESVIAAINALLPNSYAAIGTINNGGKITLSSLIDYVKNLTRLYIALLANTSIPKSTIADLNESVEIDFSQLVKNQIHNVMDDSLGEQNAKIKELQHALNVLNTTIEQLKSYSEADKKPIAVNIAQNVTPASVVAGVTTPSRLPEETSASSEKPANQSLKNSEIPPIPLANNSSSTGEVVNTNNTGVNITGNVMSSNAMTTPASVIHKPSQTGQSLNKPELRPDSPPPD